MRFPKVEHRLVTPLLRVNNELREIGWEHALDTLADHISVSKREQNTHLAFLGTSAMSNEEAYLFQRFARTVAMSNNVDFIERDPLVSELIKLVGSVGLGVDVYDLQKTDCAVILGCDIYRHLPIAWLWILKAVMRQEAKLTVVGVTDGKTKMKKRAWRWLEVSNDDGLALDKLTKALVTLIAQIKNLPLPPYISISEVEWLKDETVFSIAEALTKSERPVVICASSDDPQAVSFETVMALREFLVKPGWDAVCYALHHANFRGCMEVGLANGYLPGLRPIGDDDMHLLLQQLWGIEISKQKGHDFKAILELAQKGELKSAWVVDPSPLYGLSEVIVETLSKIPNLIVSASTLTNLAQKAWLVLPDLTFLEKNGSYTNWSGYSQIVRRAISPPSGARSLGLILMSLSERLGKPMQYHSLEFVQNEIEQLRGFSRKI